MAKRKHVSTFDSVRNLASGKGPTNHKGTPTKPIGLTLEQKNRMRPAVQRTASYLGDEITPDMETVCDAGRLITLGGMSRADHDALMASYDNADTKRWLRSLI